ncbi:hypothetical protein KQI68_04955 [Peptoniphilus sp. MSJ-1]|uniref:Uncharacterized protein n=1 Tax=Peptoniphilus ovalis TaxID=2841503 RepID=A0ABS6FGC2_9FIRM|nr:hypothetical protein [Peptoniphilus ovalis]MBU5669190.1 hypothetical protein [Peptoniphilus ovalis]
MDIFDKLSNKIGYRRFSNREKILFSILILLLIQLIIYYFFIKPKDELYSEKLSNYENSKNIKEENLNYSGLNDFSNENLALIANDMNLSKNNFSKEQNSNIETLSILGESSLDNLSSTKKFIKYYGFSTINIQRDGENKFSYDFKAVKPSENIYYSDLKSSYFSGDKEELKIEVKDEENKPQEKVEIKNTKTTPKKTSVKQKLKKVAKVEEKPKTIENIIPKEIIENKEPQKLEEIIVDNIEKDESSEILFNEFALSSSNKNVEIDNIRNIISVINIKEPKEEKIIIGLDRICGEIDFSFLLSDHIKEFGVLNTNEEFIKYNGDIPLKTWTSLNFKEEKISALYIIPYEGVETSMYIGEFTYHEEV